MPFGSMGGNLDVAQIVLYLFWIFFVGLIFWIRKEDRREGYPLEVDRTGIVNRPDPFLMPKPKEFLLDDGTVVKAPNLEERDNERALAAKKVNRLPGSPYQPTGDPMVDGVGPAAYVPRRKVPEKTLEGHNLISPMRELEGYDVAKQSTDPRGMDVLGDDGVRGGTVADIWVDVADQAIRYLEVELDAEGGGSVLLPMPAARLNVSKRRIEVGSILGGQFAKVPRLSNPTEVTADEEDKIGAYYAGGRMYATPSRQEPLL